MNRWKVRDPIRVDKDREYEIAELYSRGTDKNMIAKKLHMDGLRVSEILKKYYDIRPGRP